jgi:hypothetical protein
VWIKDKYHPETGESAYRRKENLSDYLYITQTALVRAFTKRLKKDISYREITGEFHDAGILMEDMDRHSKKFQNIRHYVINVKTLETIIETLED